MSTEFQDFSENDNYKEALVSDTPSKFESLP